MTTRLSLLVALLVGVGSAVSCSMKDTDEGFGKEDRNDLAASRSYSPAVNGPEGQRAFDELSALYRGGKNVPDYAAALTDLDNTSLEKRSSAAKYLSALMKQSHADETSGRGPWRRLVSWGGGAKCPARDFRTALATQFGERAKAVEALEGALWLVDVDPCWENTAQGAKALARIPSRDSAEIFRRLLKEPHPNQAVCLAVIEAVGRREMIELAPDVKRLSTHYRQAVRQAARMAAETLGVKEFPEYRPADAFTPRLTQQIESIREMLLIKVPAQCKWVQFVVTSPPRGNSREPSVSELSGWLLGEDENRYRFLDQFGHDRWELKEQTTIAESSLRNEADRLLKIRTLSARDMMDQLSVSGGLSGQFEAGCISLREALVVAWCFERGDKETAAALLFPRIDEAADDGWIGSISRDLLGNSFHQDMLIAFSHQRDYQRTIELAEHLSKAPFDGYQYQDRAKELARRLPERRDDFGKFALPTPDQWQAQKAKLDREGQIKFLASRLRLLNCFQRSWPGEVSYRDLQYAQPHGPWAEKVELEKLDRVINPYVELLQMKIEARELPALVPLLADNDFIPTFDFWRPWHPDRTLHRVNWLVAALINDLAKRDLAQLDAYSSLDDGGKQQHLDALHQWCRDNAGRSRTDLLIQTLRKSENQRDYICAVQEAAELRLVETLPLVHERMRDFPSLQDRVVYLWHQADTAATVDYAHKWVNSDDKETRFWATLILLRHGSQRQQQQAVGSLPKVLKDLDHEEELYWLLAVEPLLALKTENASKLACGVLSHEEFRPVGHGERIVLHRMFLAGRQESLDYLLRMLTNQEKYGPDSVVGDRVAALICEWRTDDHSFDWRAPPAERSKARQELAAWLKRQFALIKAGKNHALRPQPDPLDFGPSEARFDAP